MDRRAFAGGLCLAVLGSLWGMAILRNKIPPQTEAETSPVVPQSESGPHSVSTEQELLGIVIAEESVDLAPRFNGRVKSVRVQVGQEVRQGAVVATLDAKTEQNELIISEAELRSSRAEEQLAALALDEARERLQRREDPKQVSTGALSQEELSTARYQERSATAKLEVARAKVSEQEARVAHLRLRVTEAVIRAPFDGVIASRFVHPGALVQAGQGIVHLLHTSALQVRFAIPTARVRGIQGGDLVEVVVSESGLRLNGRVSLVAPEVDVASLMVFALAELDVPADARVIPAGTVVRVNVLTAQASAAANNK